jgi:hypothetical protein
MSLAEHILSWPFALHSPGYQAVGLRDGGLVYATQLQRQPIQGKGL